MLQRFVDLQLELFEIERFDDVVEGACPHRLDRRLYRPVGGHHQHDGSLVDPFAVLEDLDTAAIRHLVVGYDDVEDLALEHRGRLGAVGRLADLPVAITERLGDSFTQGRLVVDDK